MEWFETIANSFETALTDWPEAYDANARGEHIGYVSDHLRDGVPVSERLTDDGSLEPLDDADILNAGWIGWAASFDVPVQRLVAKALESREFLRRWQESGGEAAKLDPQGDVSETKAAGTLSREEVARRLRSSGSDRIIVTPLLPEWGAGAATDLRLGNRFIVFQRTRTGSFDPLRLEHDPRSMQVLLEREWGDPFVLHPGELVLASSLEYLVLPADVAGQVVTRSSYGRLGLMTATAVLAHPHFRGCLTLELVNLGVVPIELTPGERIAQVMFQRVEPPAPPPPQKYAHPTGPEFSKVRDDADADVLRRMRQARG
jgi:deoxycytidine triphosphate deaminase